MLYFIFKFYKFHLLVVVATHQYLLVVFIELLRRYPQQRIYIHALFFITQLLLFVGFILLDFQLGFVLNGRRCTTGLALGISFFLF